MKLRLHDSSVRLRLTRPEVERVGAGERVTADSQLPDGSTFRYAIVVVPDGVVTARMAAGVLEVLVPRPLASAWATSETVSIRADHEVEHGRCQLLIEKDFACLHPRPEDAGLETYPNPTTLRDSS